MIDLPSVGSRIRELRKQRGLTQCELADALSVSFQAVSNWERGVTPPDLENLARIAAYFGVLVDTLLSPIGEPLYLGIDGGGTKTAFVLVSATGHVYRRIKTSGCNPNDIGYAEAEALIVGTIRELLTENPTVKGIFGGIAGMSSGPYANALQATLKKQFGHIPSQIRGDAFNLFALDDEADMVLISGTGSVVFVKETDGYRRLGGWGYLFERAGSGYDIGRDAVSEALREEDALESPSHLTCLLRQKMETATVWEHINALHRGGKPYVASLAPIVFDAYRAGDEHAVSIIDQNAKGLAERLNLGVTLYGAKPVALAGGGLMAHYSDILTAHLRRYTDVQVRVADLPPVCGACRMACTVGGERPDAHFYKNFKTTYTEVTP